MNYKYKGLDIPIKRDDLKKAYIELNDIRSSIILYNLDLFLL